MPSATERCRSTCSASPPPATRRPRPRNWSRSSGRGPSVRSITVKTHMEAVTYLGGGTTSPRTGFLAGSDVLKGPMNAATITALLAAVKAAARAKTPASAILDPLGGQAAKQPTGGASWPWRSALGVVQWYCGTPGAPDPAQLRRSAQTFITNGHRAVRAYSAGGYVNYVETGRSVSTYYGASLARCRRSRRSTTRPTSSRPRTLRSVVRYALFEACGRLPGGRCRSPRRSGAARKGRSPGAGTRSARTPVGELLRLG